MAKNFKNNGKKKPKTNGYFTQNIQRDGPEFVNRLNPQNITRDASRIFRDLAFSGSALAEQITPCFFNRTFVANLCDVALAEYTKAVFTNNALCAFYTNSINCGWPIDPNACPEKYISDMQKTAEAYGIILYDLNNIVNIISTGYDEEWKTNSILNTMRSMGSKLSSYRYCL